MPDPSDSSSPPDLPADKTSSKPAPTPGRFRFSKVLSRWWWLATILIAAVTYIVAMIPSWLDMDGPLYESTALLEVKPIADVDTWSASRSGPTVTRQFMHTQFEIIKSAATLELALGKNDLLRRMGGDKSEAVARIRKSIITNQRYGTDLMQLSYRDEDARLAYDAATAVMDAYKERRAELELEARRQQLKAIKVELENKQDRVAKLRKELIALSGKLGATWVEDKATYEFPGLKQREVVEKEYYEAKRLKGEMEVQMKRLSVVDRESVLASAEILKKSNEYILRIHERFLLRESELNALKSAGLAGEHPKIKHYTERMNEAEALLKKAVTKEIAAQQAQLVLQTKRTEELKKHVLANQDKTTGAARTYQEFNVAGKEYQTAKRLQEQMEVRHDLEKTKTVIPPNNIIVHELPDQAGSPSTRGREFVASVGTVCSLPFSLAFGILIMYIAELAVPRRDA